MDERNKIPTSLMADSPAPGVGSHLLAFERRLLQFSLGDPIGFLMLRLLLAFTLFMQVLTTRSSSGRLSWLAVVPAAYAAAAALTFRLRKSGKLPDALSLAFFLIDVGASLAVLRFVEGAGGNNTYTALLLLIIGSCLLQRPLLILALSLSVSMIYGFMALPAFPDPYPAYLMRLSMFLLIALFGAHIADYAAMIERRTAVRYEERLAWMQRLSIVGKAMAAVLHEAKTPLGTIVLTAESAADMLRRGQDPSAELRGICEEADHAHAILQNFLDFVKPSQLDLRRLFVHEPLLQAVGMARVRLDERGIKTELRTRDDCPVLGSVRHLVQAFANIINNAVDAMPSGGTLTVRMEKEAGKAHIVFQDTGAGMSPETVDRLFEPFATSKAGEEGHGLGLSIVRWIMQEHLGGIEVRSAGLSRGSRVTLFLPLDAVS